MKAQESLSNQKQHISATNKLHSFLNNKQQTTLKFQIIHTISLNVKIIHPDARGDYYHFDVIFSNKIVIIIIHLYHNLKILF